ncbi:MAG: tryptophan 7-halogenase [Candidatus Obscuribacterales bacterium]|nr:tryptophan 7-halogenase [Steroidobacteraceae bacterium]
MPDVLIIGAGPAGSMAAAHLAAKGYDVLVLEKQRFPRFSIGESLLANSLEMLNEAGMLEAVMACGFQFKNGAAFRHNDRYSEFNFAEKFSAGSPFTFQVPRAQFDEVLANEAAKRGAKIHYEVEITAVDVSGDRPVVTSKAGDEITTHRPRFVLDASGFGRTLPRLLNLDRPSDFPVRAALFVHVKDGIVAGAFDRQKIRVGIHPTETHVWSWLIPFSNGNSSLGIVATKEFHAKFTGTNEERLWKLIGEEPLLKDLLKDAKTVRPVGEIVGYAAKVSSLHGPGFALLGNAAEFLDPVFSSGVTIAMKSASLAADILDRQFKGEGVNWQTEFAEPLNYGVETFRSFVTGWYDGSLQDVIFFERQEPAIRRMICSVLAGYVWDTKNPYTGPRSGQRLRALAQLCRA